MNWATRCTACGTIFRVVQDQLKVSDGWVRCGRCQAVFNAQLSLFDLEREAPPPWPAVASTPDAHEAVESPAATDQHTPDDAATAEPQPGAHDTWPDAASSLESGHAELASERPADSTTEMADGEYADATVAHDSWPRESDLAADTSDAESIAPVDTEATIEATASDDAVPAEQDAATADETTSATPDFVRQAERDERWERAPVRAALVLLAVVAALGLALQVTGHYRQRIAAQWPQSMPWLQRYCTAFGCRIDALRRIDDVSIESTALTQADASLPDDGSPNALRLAVTLRNRGELPIAMPSVDLSLTGADGELVARRALSPADFQVTDPRLTPGADAPMAVSFPVTGHRVSGYTVEVFYP
jgi:predicted Zn finger-like uncharacterized protein